jgi:pilus assembly protein Flp/PilA
MAFIRSTLKLTATNRESGFRGHTFNRTSYFSRIHTGMKTVRKFLADESAATAIEYGLIAAGISLAIIAVINGLGSKLNTKFTAINTSLK